MKISVPLLRDLASLVIGSAGMVNELFIVPSPRGLGLGISVALLCGPTAIVAGWQIWAARGSAGRSPGTTPVEAPSSPPQSS